ncbi:hypothetical protein DITRI_Ditri08aG0075000 [Diplodiscus trichospermus]
MANTIGILVTSLINYNTTKIKGAWGCRLSLALAVVPSILMTNGSFVLPDTPNSVLERGHTKNARQMMQKIRSTPNVDAEFQDIVDASFGDDASLMYVVVSGTVNVVTTVASIYSVDRFERRILFFEGGTQMIVIQIAIGIMITLKFKANGDGELSRTNANVLLFLICAYVSTFTWSWRPLGWLIPSDICPLEIRSAGQAINVVINMIFTFAIASVFISMLCHLKDEQSIEAILVLGKYIPNDAVIGGNSKVEHKDA